MPSLRFINVELISNLIIKIYSITLILYYAYVFKSSYPLVMDSISTKIG